MFCIVRFALHVTRQYTNGEQERRVLFPKIDIYSLIPAKTLPGVLCRNSRREKDMYNVV